VSTVIIASNFITEEEYLECEVSAERKHEYIDGDIYAMAGASENHDYISGNIFGEFHAHLKNSSCRPFTSDIKVKTAKGSFRYPDCMVVCEEDKENAYYKTKPVILVEVLSRSTRKIDEKEKLLEYINIPSLKEYVLIEQDFVDITVYRKSDSWRSTHYFLEEDIYFESIDLTLSVEEIYHRVNNDDMVEFLEKKQSEE
jgi:Uma2 family endonuclease